MTTRKKLKEGDEAIVAIIGDEDTVTGFLLAGIGDVDVKGQGNFLIVDSKTAHSTIEDAFKRFTSKSNVAILLINQHIANDIRYLLDAYDKTIPAILEIPSKDHPYDASKDYILQRVKTFFGEDK